MLCYLSAVSCAGQKSERAGGTSHPQRQQQSWAPTPLLTAGLLFFPLLLPHSQRSLLPVCEHSGPPLWAQLRGVPLRRIW